MLKIITISGLLLISPMILESSNTQLDMASLVNDLMNSSDLIKKRINRSGKQRMLTQRMSKTAVLVSLNINSEMNKKALLQDATLYSTTLNDFKNSKDDFGFSEKANKQIKAQLILLEGLWNPFFKELRKIIDEKDKKNKALNYLISHNEKLLQESNKLVSLYEKSNISQNYIEKAMVSIMNLAGRQRMLSQKMTKEKLLLVRGQKGYISKLEQTITLFDESLILLREGSLKKKISKPTNPKIKTQLIEVDKLWSELKPLFLKSKPSAQELASIIQKNITLLDETNKVVALIEQETEY